MAEETKTTTTVEETGTSTVETTDDIAMQLAQAKAELERFKNASDKASKEAAEYKRQLRAKQSDEEAKASALAEAEAEREAEREAMRAELNLLKATNAYKEISDEKTVKQLIDAVSNADHTAIATIIANERKRAVAEAEQGWLKDRPPVSSGTFSTTTREQIMAISDRAERRKAIAENPHLFN